jgi:hypothetical protein
MSVKIFLSTVSDEFRAYRDALRTDLTRHNVEVKVQEDSKILGWVLGGPGIPKIKCAERTCEVLGIDVMVQPT